MLGPYFSLNGHILPVSQARIPIDNLEFTYGYGVYEALKVRKKHLFFLEKHVARLFNSASVLGIIVQYSQAQVAEFVKNFLHAIPDESYNIKMLLVGKNLYIFATAPLYPPSRLYSQGASVITMPGERKFVQAKTLNMLESYLLYKEAKQAGAYDTLLVHSNGEIVEGTRTNLFYTDGEVIYTAPQERVLNGVTRSTVIETLRKAGIRVVERTLHKDELEKFCGYFLTSTSSKVMPISQIDGMRVEIPQIVQRVRRIYMQFLEEILKEERFN